MKAQRAFFPLGLFGLAALSFGFAAQETPTPPKPPSQGPPEEVSEEGLSEEALSEEALRELEEKIREIPEAQLRASVAGGRSHAELMNAAIRSAAADDWGPALEASNAAMLMLPYMDELQLAEAHYLQGWLLAQRPVVEVLQQAENARAEQAGEEPRELRPFLPGLVGFQESRVLAGRSDLRLRSIYNMGCVYLLDGDEWRSEIPEIAQAQGGGQAQPGMPGMPGGQGGGAEGEEPPDPLQRARSSYGQAKSWLVERLKADWRDEDTRANLELIQRRLRELDEIEKQREEQQQEQEQQEGDENQEGDQEQNNEEDGDSQDSENQEQEGNPEDPQEGEEGEQDQQQPSDPGEGEKQEEQQQPVPEEGMEEQAPQPHEGPQDKERHLTREEVMRLLDKLSEMEDEYRAFQEAMRAARRIPVERDW